MLPVELQSFILTYSSFLTLERIAVTNKSYLQRVQEHLIRYPKQVNHLSVLLRLLHNKLSPDYDISFRYYPWVHNITLQITYNDPKRKYQLFGCDFDNGSNSSWKSAVQDQSRKGNLLIVNYYDPWIVTLSYQPLSLNEIESVLNVMRCYPKYNWDFDRAITDEISFDVIFESVRWRSKFIVKSDLTWKSILGNLDIFENVRWRSEFIVESDKAWKSIINNLDLD